MFFNKNIVNIFLSQIKHYDTIYNSLTLSDIQNAHPSEELLEWVLFDILSIQCKNINSNYIKALSKELSQFNSKYDMIILFKFATLSIEDDVDNLVYLKNAVAGILITEKGKCMKYPTINTVNLICSNDGKGSLLVGLYLYIIKTQNLNILDNGEQIGLLELSGGYNNIAGLCTYEKFNFKIDDTLFDENCFNEINNIPMISNITNLSDVDIINIVTKKSSKKIPKHVLCSLHGTTQLNLSRLLSLQRILEINPQDISQANRDLLSQFPGKNDKAKIESLDSHIEHILALHYPINQLGGSKKKIIKKTRKILRKKTKKRFIKNTRKRIGKKKQLTNKR